MQWLANDAGIPPVRFILDLEMEVLQSKVKILPLKSDDLC